MDSENWNFDAEVDLLNGKFMIKKTLTKDDEKLYNKNGWVEGLEEPYAPPLPLDTKKAFQLFKDYYAAYRLLLEKQLFFEKYGTLDDFDGIVSELETIEEFIKNARAANRYSDIVEKYNNTDEGMEYVKLCGNYYNLNPLNEFNVKTNGGLSSRIYGKYVLFYDYLKFKKEQIGINLNLSDKHTTGANLQNSNTSRPAIGNIEKMSRWMDIIKHLYSSQYLIYDATKHFHYPTILNEDGTDYIDGRFLCGFKLYSQHQLLSKELFKEYITERFESAKDRTLIINQLQQIANKAQENINYYETYLTIGNSIVDDFIAKRPAGYSERPDYLEFHTAIVFITHYYTIEAIYPGANKDEIDGYKSYCYKYHFPNNKELLYYCAEILEFIKLFEVVPENKQPNNPNPSDVTSKNLQSAKFNDLYLIDFPDCRKLHELLLSYGVIEVIKELDFYQCFNINSIAVSQIHYFKDQQNLMTYALSKIEGVTQKIALSNFGIANFNEMKRRKLPKSKRLKMEIKKQIDKILIKDETPNPIIVRST